ncbi:MAG: DNA-3-methyladenine glycosylase 2 family protein [Thermomicrobiales bacterium]|nr:DNA-3-methyladenine glycosylase 2 family protein [Thermomicrobiales bacterium]
MSSHEKRHVSARPFDLTLTAAPVAWGRGRWPNVDWIDGQMVWVGWEGKAIVHRIARQEPDGTLVVRGDATDDDIVWLDGVLGWSAEMPSFTDPVITDLSAKMPGLRPFANGSLFDGIIGSIVGQSISVAAAATTERRLAQLTTDGVELFGRRFFPSPRAEDLVQLSIAEIRSTGVTGRRAEAISAIAHRAMAGEFPAEGAPYSDDADLRRLLRALPLVGPWTAESAMLWGIGMPDIHPTGDVALLRAAKLAYERPEMTMKELDQLAIGWAPGRSWAARLLWTALLGPAPALEL